MYKILGADQKEYGPVSADQIRQWISEGRINRQTSLQLAGDVWKAASEFPEFAASLPQTPPPPVTTPIPPVGISYPGAPQSNALATWSMVVGIVSLCCCGFPGPVAIIMGVIAQSQIKKTPGMTGNSFAITGIVLGIISILLAIFTVMGWASSLANANMPEMMEQFKHFNR